MKATKIYSENITRNHSFEEYEAMAQELTFIAIGEMRDFNGSKSMTWSGFFARSNQNQKEGLAMVEIEMDFNDGSCTIKRY